MFIAIIGTRCSGKNSLKDYLRQHGCIAINLFGQPPADENSSPEITENTNNRLISQASVAESFLSLNSPITPAVANIPKPSTFSPSKSQTVSQELWFSSATEMLDYITRHWRHDFVTTDIIDKDTLEEFAVRPFFLLVSVDAPLLERFRRAQTREDEINLEGFVREHDRIMYQELSIATHTGGSSTATLHSMQPLIDVHIVNAFNTVAAFYSHLDSLHLLDPDRIRPRWDTYFMRLASLASLRSNCMKRRVGAILVRNNRILATGYNGTPRGLQNCNEGGCARCNGSSPSGQALDECVCLHAEENALLEAGRERIGDGAVLYCNTCPCLRCTVKIIQTGVKEVVYNLSYKVDDASMALFEEANVRLRRHAPPQ